LNAAAHQSAAFEFRLVMTLPARCQMPVNDLRKILTMQACVGIFPQIDRKHKNLAFRESRFVTFDG
jgi:hypothetical protein